MIAARAEQILLRRRALSTAFWPLFDQVIVSVGTFAVNLILARNLPTAEYGVFALLVSAFLTLQLLNTSLLFHPLIVSLPHVRDRAARRIITVTCILTGCTSLILAALIGLGLTLLGRPELVPCAVAAFVAQQMQEAPRRCLFAELGHRAAILGDGVSYLGQGALVLLLIPLHLLTIENALWSMAATSVAAMLLQLRSIRFGAVRRSDLRRVAAEFWIVGRWILAYSAVSFLRLQVVPWILAAVSGPATAGMFQAAMNVLNVANPILLGLSNVIPQVAARAQAEQRLQARDDIGHDALRHAASWRAVRVYLLLGLPVVAFFYGSALATPELLLRILYGAQSDYRALGEVVQVLALAAMLAYGADMLSSFLHGVNAARTALSINLVGATAVVILAVPAIKEFGMTGCCWALVVASALRLASAAYTVLAMTRPEGMRIGRKAWNPLAGRLLLIGRTARLRSR